MRSSSGSAGKSLRFVLIGGRWTLVFVPAFARTVSELILRVHPSRLSCRPLNCREWVLLLLFLRPFSESGKGRVLHRFSARSTGLQASRVGQYSPPSMGPAGGWCMWATLHRRSVIVLLVLTVRLCLGPKTDDELFDLDRL